MTLHYELYSVKQIRDIEADALSSVSELTLMTRAGEGAFQTLMDHYPDFESIAVMCGAGNNGGDGFVVARLAFEAGLNVKVFTIGDLSTLSDAAKSAYEAIIEKDVAIQAWDENSSVDEFDVIVDALLGIGLSGEVRSPYADVIHAINESDSHVVSIDLPSGIEADTGAVLGTAVYASMTVTFIGLKQGLLTGEAVDYTGEVVVSHLDLEEEIENQPISALRLDDDALLSYLPVRTKSAHKGDLGHVLVIGGDVGMAGAARLCAEAALRVGAGAVTVATHAEHVPVVLSGRPELMCAPVNTEKDLHPLLEKADVVVVGPGLGETKWSTDLIKQALLFQGAKVIDAGALSFLSTQKAKIANAIMTPHPGEAGRLLGTTARLVQADRFKAVIALVKQYADVVVLKGAGTLVQSINEMPEVCSLGNPGMATAGMGDVLAGIIAGLCAQGCTNEEAAKAGVVLHALSADKAVVEKGEYGLLASDLFAYFSSCMELSPVVYDWVEADAV